MKIWIFLDGKQQGPFEFEELRNMPVTKETKVWFEGLPKWYPAGMLPQMQELFVSDSVQQTEYPEQDTTDQASSQQEQNQEADSTADYQEQYPQHVQDTAPQEAPAQPYWEPYLNQGNYQAAAPVAKEPCPPTYIGWSIFLLICCCSPVSVAALVASICVTSFYNSNRIDQAKKASQVAAWLIMISLALGLFPCILLGALF